MKKLTLKTDAFSKGQVLTREQLKKVTGGVMDRETTLQWCYDQVENQAMQNSDPVEREIMTRVGYQICYDAYLQMTS